MLPLLLLEKASPSQVGEGKPPRRVYSGVEANEASSTLQLAETVQDAQITYFAMPPDPKKSQERFQCPYCPVVVSWKDSLKRHIFIKHSETQVFFACPTCDTKYTSRDSLRRHIKSKHASDGTMQLYKSKIQQRKAPKRKKSAFTYVHGKNGTVHKRKRRTEWSKDEKALFQRLHSQYNKDWKAIAEKIGTKTANQIRTHAYTCIRKKPPQPRPGYTYDSKAARKESDRILAEEEAKRSKITDVTTSSHDAERTRSL